MPIIKSAQKRVRVAKKAAVRNAKTKRHLKDAIKSLQSALKTGKKSVDKELAEAQSAIDTAVKKNVIHKNKAARKKAALVRAAKAAGASAPKKAAKTPAKSTTPKKPAASAGQRKSPAKKPAKK
jgi:ribosomal protein S20